MFSRRQRHLTQLVIDAARDGRFCYHSGDYWVFLRRGTNDMVQQVNISEAKLCYLNQTESYQVLRANPPRHEREGVRMLQAQLESEASGQRIYF
jgi:hypothetical protein